MLFIEWMLVDLPCKSYTVKKRYFNQIMVTGQWSAVAKINRAGADEKHCFTREPIIYNLRLSIVAISGLYLSRKIVYRRLIIHYRYWIKTTKLCSPVVTCASKFSTKFSDRQLALIFSAIPVCTIRVLWQARQLLPSTRNLWLSTAQHKIKRNIITTL